MPGPQDNFSLHHKRRTLEGKKGFVMSQAKEKGKGCLIPSKLVAQRVMLIFSSLLSKVLSNLLKGYIPGLYAR